MAHRWRALVVPTVPAAVVAVVAEVVPPVHTRGTREVHPFVSFTRVKESERGVNQHMRKQLRSVMTNVVLFLSMVGVAVLTQWLIHGVVRVLDVVRFLVLPFALLAFYHFLKGNGRPRGSNHNTEP